MARVRAKDTKPELALRRALHAAGLRFRLHAKELPGRPDVVFRPAKLAIFVHGCFWHGHGCARAREPATRREYWGPKLAANRARDARDEAALRAAGWTVLTLWECEGAAGREAVVGEAAERVRAARRAGGQVAHGPRLAPG